ncbi:hypothetical protein ZIOFF_062907 [Zingiber officinale]|uniref:Uncharacterized protein n=1 Tax=Zingiber officinale TaxID=94328 RepID=A0A8J5KAZ9_ZINOF|nr:hypothetical protein ZIOFF_062907 [Zingiber officinale]
MLFDEYQGDEEIRFLFLRCHHQELERPVVLQYKHESDTVSVPGKDEILNYNGSYSYGFEVDIVAASANSTQMSPEGCEFYRLQSAICHLNFGCFPKTVSKEFYNMKEML